MKIEKGNAQIPVNAQISRADIIAKFKLPEDAVLALVDGNQIHGIDDCVIISAEYTETRKPRKTKAAA